MNLTTRKIFRLVLCLMLVLSLFSGCAREEDAEPTIPRFKFLRKKAETLTVAAVEADFPLLEECVNLQYLDLSGSTCYDLILDYVNDHPNVEVVYTAPLGDLMLSSTETQAALEPDSYDIDTLRTQLHYLPGLTALALPKTTLTADELESLRDPFPELEITYSVELNGTEYLPDCTSLDLSSLPAGELDDLGTRLGLFPAVQEVTLSDALTMADVKALMERFPEINFNYTFELFGKTLSTADETADLTDATIGDAGEAQIRAALDIMPRCTYFKLENCGLSNEVLGGIQQDYPETKIVWRVSFGGQYSVLTDETTLRTVYGVENSHNDVLKYCTSLKYIDMGHNPTLTDISFIEYMPDLEIVILSGASMTDLDVFANCKKLEWLELANCYALEDISGLATCESLRFLNICFSKVTDLSPIEDLPLERFLYLTPQIDKETQTAFEESHPDCWVRFTGSDPYSLGWRYNDVGITRFEYYQKIRDIFQYDAVDRRLAQQAAAEEERQWQEEQANKQEGESSAAPESTPEATPAPETTPAPEPEPAPAPESDTASDTDS